MKCTDIRQKFIEFFGTKSHQVVPSASLVPQNDPTLLFINAGMVPFKDVFLGSEQRPYSRAVSVQRCVRAGGKHNDLENVGYTARHHTFFEMLGNFSFGDYFKSEAIQFSWTFLTEELKLPQEKLWISVYKDDHESADIWMQQIGVPEDRISYCGDEDNFWSMGDTGPCGPCSEIFYDHGEEISGGPPGSADQDGDRYIEIWNLVFMQYDRDAQGHLSPLPKPCVDTGMGLERLSAVMQGVHSNYEIDLFQHLIGTVAQITRSQDKRDPSLRVIADHIRSTSFLICDGVVPSHEGRGYVLRRIIRRAVRHGHKLGIKKVFFYRLVSALVEQMGEAYPELVKAQRHIEKVLQQEEEQFAKTLDQGLKIFAQGMAELRHDTVPGELAFKLYDTYGFPVDLTADLAREKGLQVDIAGFEHHMLQQKQRSQHTSQFSSDETKTAISGQITEFTGYDNLAGQSTVLTLIQDGEKLDHIDNNKPISLELNGTPFYAESGGQVGDIGEIVSESGSFKVEDTRKVGESILHIGHLTQGQIAIGDRVSAKVAADYRQAIVINHSATHLLHAALRQLLGEHVQQKGSLVDAQRLRFDFVHFEPLQLEAITAIEDLVNDKIRENLAVHVDMMTPEQADKRGAMALFGEKYDDIVRVLTMGDFSMELCGGTHVKHTGDIGFFSILSETGIAAGIRRIEAVTGDVAVKRAQQHSQALGKLSQLTKIQPSGLLEKISQTLKRNKELEKIVQQLQQKLTSKASDDLSAKVKEINGVNVLSIKLNGVDVKVMRDTLDQLKNKLGSAVIVLAIQNDCRVNVIAGVTKDKIDRVSAGDLVNFVAEQIGGRGGGRPDMAQAGGNQPENLSLALESVFTWVEQRL